MKAILITVIIAFVTGLIGLAYGKLYLANSGVDWWLPENLIDTKNFISVGSMHNFSYLGGLFGLIAGTIYSVKQKKKNAFNNRYRACPAGHAHTQTVSRNIKKCQ